MISSLLDVAGLGLSSTVVAMLVGALWIWRGRRILMLIGGLASSAITIVVSLLIVLVASTVFGWVEIHPGLLFEDVVGLVRWLGTTGVSVGRSVIEIVV